MRSDRFLSGICFNYDWERGGAARRQAYNELPSRERERLLEGGSPNHVTLEEWMREDLRRHYLVGAKFVKQRPVSNSTDGSRTIYQLTGPLGEGTAGPPGLWDRLSLTILDSDCGWAWNEELRMVYKDRARPLLAPDELIKAGRASAWRPRTEYSIVRRAGQ